MGPFVLRRLLGLIPVLLGITVIVFAIMAMIPGDPATAILGAYKTPERVAELERELGLDRPLVVQYFTWLGNLLTLDFGRSYSLNRPVLDVILERMGPTLLLAGAALAIASVLGLLAGAIAAVKQHAWQDKLLTLLVLVGISTPAFWLAMLLVLVFAVWTQLFPVSGMTSVHGAHAGGVVDLLHHLALPAISLGLVATGVIARMTRTAMLEELGQSYVRIARAKGLPEEAVLYRHAFKNAFARVIPVLGLQAGFVLGGAVYIETVFQWPGIGSLLVEAISKRDLLLVQGGVVVVASAYVLVNLFTDVVHRAVDPRTEA